MEKPLRGVDSSVFKKYDLRGRYPEDIDEAFAQRLGRAYGRLFKPKKIIIGRDARLSSPHLKKAFCQTLLNLGVDIVDIGLCATPQLYFAANFYNCKEGVMVTASHAEKNINGFKFIEGSFPLRSKKTALLKKAFFKEAESAVVLGRATKDGGPPIWRAGELEKKDSSEDYIRELKRWLKIPLKPFRLVIDAGNSVYGPLVGKVFSGLGLDLRFLYTKVDGTFPHHGLNPKLPENRRNLAAAIKEGHADLGFIWDGDGDRFYVLGQDGNVFSPHFVSALIGEYLLPRSRGKKMTVEVRTSKVVKDLAGKVGGEVLVIRPWHTEIKYAMRKDKEIVFGSETSGHYVFRDFYKSDDGLLAALVFLQALSLKKENPAELLEKLKSKYFILEEVNFGIKREPQEVYQGLAKVYQKGKVSWLDGLTVEFPTWRFNLRTSETEPLFRLNLDATSKKDFAERKEKVISLVTQLNQPVA